MDTGGPPVSVLWSLRWRATLAFPLAVVGSVIALTLSVLVLVLPVAVTLHAVSGDWSSAALTLLVWLPCFAPLWWAWHRGLKHRTRHEHGVL